MTKKNFGNSNQREAYKNYTPSKYELELLENGAKQLLQSWILGALYQKWKKIKRIPPGPPPPDCQSSFIEWEKKAKQLEQDD